MAFATSALITLVLPTTYADGTTPWPAKNYGGAIVFRDGTQIGTVSAPALTYNDLNVPVGTHSYTVEVRDSVDLLFSVMSPPVSFTQAGQPPGQPVITSITPF